MPWRVSRDRAPPGRPEPGSWTTVWGSASRRACERGELPGGDSSPASWAREESSVWHAVSRASTARAAAAAGLLISCARSAASLPSVTRDSRCRAVDSMDRAVLYSPSMRCLPSGNQSLSRSRSTPAGTRSTRPAPPRAVAGRCRARQRRGIRGPWPGTSHPHHGVLKADVAHEVHRPVNEHPPVVRDLTLAEQVHAGLEADLGAVRTSSASWSRGPRRGRYGQVVDEHQTTAETMGSSTVMTTGYQSAPPGRPHRLPMGPDGTKRVGHT